MKLTPDQAVNLLWLADRGGEGMVDRYGRVVAAGETRPQGSWIAWLRLVALGLIEGDDRRLKLTSKGRMRAAQEDGDRAERRAKEARKWPGPRSSAEEPRERAGEEG